MVITMQEELEKQAQAEQEATPAEEPAENPAEEKADKKKAKKEAKLALEKELEEQKAIAQKAQEELATYKQQHLRVLAEYDNYRKRTEREKAAIYNDATAAAVAALLPVEDNMERALSQKDCTAEQMREGVEMVNRQLLAAFEKLGVCAMGEVGEAFDPEKHNAVSHIEDENLGENIISAVYQKGYVLGDKIVRHAMVQVAN